LFADWVDAAKALLGEGFADYHDQFGAGGEGLPVDIASVASGSHTYGY